MKRFYWIVPILVLALALAPSVDYGTFMTAEAGQDAVSDGDGSSASDNDAVSGGDANHKDDGSASDGDADKDEGKGDGDDGGSGFPPDYIISPDDTPNPRPDDSPGSKPDKETDNSPGRNPGHFDKVDHTAKHIRKVESLIRDSIPNSTVTLKEQGEKGITLANSTMKELLKRSDVTLVLEYNYKGVDYKIVIPAGTAFDDDIPWCGPLYLAARFGNMADADGEYTVRAGDSLSKIAKKNQMTLGELLGKNPQIKNPNIIRKGQKIRLR